MKIAACTLEKYVQVIPREMLETLKESAQEKDISLDMEIALRLMSSLALNDDDSLFNQVAYKRFKEKEAVAECKRKRLANLYLYEMERLRLYLHFKEKIPRNFKLKDKFTLIDVAATSKKIRDELKVEAMLDGEWFC